MKSQQDVQNLLKQLTPDQQAIAQTLALLKIENQSLSEALAKVKEAYDPLYKTMIAICHAMPGREYRIHKSQFLRFKSEYRIDSRFDEGTGEMVFRLLTISDELE